MKLPAFQFYPADWRKDPGIQSLTRHDQSVWFDMLCLMHESDERGVLLLAGKPMPNEALARILNLELTNLLETLETIMRYGVASHRELDGAIYCRRMVRDEEKRHQSKIDGGTGGNPKLTSGYDSPGFIYAIRDPENGYIKIGIATNYKLRISKIGYKLKRQMETLLVVPTDDMGTKEAQLHSTFAQYRVYGEWFNFPDTCVLTLMSSMKGLSKGDPDLHDKGKTRASSSSSSSSSSSISSSISEEIKSNGKGITPAGEEDEVFEIWNSFNSLTKIAKISTERKAKAKTRLKDSFFKQHWKAAISSIPNTPFLMGQNSKGWKADIDWFLKPESLTRIVEGKYISAPSHTQSSPPPRNMDVSGKTVNLPQSKQY